MWKKAEYKKSEINEAGKHINDANLSEDKRQKYLKIIDNWRAAHAFPMNTFAINLKHQVSKGNFHFDRSAIVVQRLKRLDTILDKLKRFPTMELYRMQDLGGCRVILSDINEVYNLKKQLQESRIRHEIHNEKDYIATPNADTGYRGVHVIYKYKSDKNAAYNGFLIELQLRTKLQHLWATAVETVGVFTQNGLKFNQGSDQWLRFFKVVSALFSIEEKSAIVEGVPTNAHEIISELQRIITELSVFEKLFTIGLAASKMGKITKSKTPGYYLLSLNIDAAELSIKKYSGIEKATDDYNRLELNKESSGIDVVLVSAQSFEALTHAYPNYFANIKEFTNKLAELMQKYDED